MTWRRSTDVAAVTVGRGAAGTPAGAAVQPRAGAGGTARSGRGWARRAPLLPALVFTIIVTQLPFLVTLSPVHPSWNAAAPGERHFVGLDNYATVLTERGCAPRLVNTVLLTAGVVLIVAGARAWAWPSCLTASSSAGAWCGPC